MANRPSSSAVADTLAGITGPKMIENYLDRLRSVVQDRIQEIGKVGVGVVPSTSFIDIL